MIDKASIQSLFYKLFSAIVVIVRDFINGYDNRVNELIENWINGIIALCTCGKRN